MNLKNSKWKIFLELHLILELSISHFWKHLGKISNFFSHSKIPSLKKLIRNFLFEFREFIHTSKKKFKKKKFGKIITIFSVEIFHNKDYFSNLGLNFRYVANHPEINLSNPGRFTGVNVGVLLLKLSKMRQNRAYNHYLTSNGIETLVNTYDGLNRTNMGTKKF